MLEKYFPGYNKLSKAEKLKGEFGN